MVESDLCRGGGCWEDVSPRGKVRLLSILINASSTEHIVGRFDVGSALVCCLKAILLSHISGPVDLLAQIAQVGTTARHVMGEFHKFVHGIVHCFDPIGIVHSEFRVIGRLDSLVVDAIRNAKCVKYKLGAICGAVGDQLVLFSEIVEEGWSVVPT